MFRFQLENMLAELEHIRARYQMRIYRESKLDMVDILVAMEDFERTSLEVEKEFIKNNVISAVRSTIGITPKVLFTDMEVMQETAGRIAVVVDERILK